MLGKMLLKTVVAVVVTVVGMTYVTHYVRDHARSLVRSRWDLSLPQRVSGHGWTPLAQGRPVPAARLRFAGGAISTVACHTTLGTYSLGVDHAFSFRPSPGRIRPGCGGRDVRARLTGATYAATEQRGHVLLLVLTDHSGRRVLALRRPGD